MLGPWPNRLFDQQLAREDGAGGEEAGARGGLAGHGTRFDAVDDPRHGSALAPGGQGKGAARAVLAHSAPVHIHIVPVLFHLFIISAAIAAVAAPAPSAAPAAAPSSAAASSVPAPSSAPAASSAPAPAPAPASASVWLPPPPLFRRISAGAFQKHVHGPCVDSDGDSDVSDKPALGFQIVVLPAGSAPVCFGVFFLKVLHHYGESSCRRVARRRGRQQLHCSPEVTRRLRSGPGRCE